MRSHITDRFRACFANLPSRVQNLAKKNYRLWKQDPFHHSLQFKQIHPTKPYYSIRIGAHWRALGIKQDQTIIWYWIGSHSEYDKLVDAL